MTIHFVRAYYVDEESGKEERLDDYMLDFDELLTEDRVYDFLKNKVGLNITRVRVIRE